MAHKTTDRLKRKRLRRDSRTAEDTQLVGYDTGDGRVDAWAGDDDAPFVKLIGPEHDDPDLGADPQKIGGHATSLLRAAVGENDMVDASFDLFGRLRVISSGSGASTDALSWAETLAGTSVVVVGAGNVFLCHVHNNNDSQLYVQLHDLAAAPGGGAVPVQSYIILPFENLSVDLSPGRAFSTGMVLALSSTFATFTAPGVTAGIYMGYLT